MEVFVNDGGRCANIGSGRTDPAMRSTRVLAALLEFANLEIIKLYPKLQRTRGRTYNVNVFTDSNRRGKRLANINSIAVT